MDESELAKTLKDAKKKEELRRGLLRRAIEDKQEDLRLQRLLDSPVINE